LQASILISDNEGNYALALISDAPAMENNKEILSNLKKEIALRLAALRKLPSRLIGILKKALMMQANCPARLERSR